MDHHEEYSMSFEMICIWSCKSASNRTRWFATSERICSGHAWTNWHWQQDMICRNCLRVSYRHSNLSWYPLQVVFYACWQYGEQIMVILKITSTVQIFIMSVGYIILLHQVLSVLYILYLAICKIKYLKNSLNSTLHNWASYSLLINSVTNIN